jgi:hypothetical protein
MSVASDILLEYWAIALRDVPGWYADVRSVL